MFIILSLGTLFIPRIIANVTTNAFAGMAVSAVLAYTAQRMMSAGIMPDLLRFYPAYIQAAGWQRWYNGNFIFIIISFLICIVSAVLASLISFQVIELK